VLLHEDILTSCVGSDSVARSSIQEMKQLAQDFFSELGLFAVSGYGNNNFEEAKDVFLKACKKTHFRYVSYIFKTNK
jgi:hypothetical protein